MRAFFALVLALLLCGCAAQKPGLTAVTDPTPPPETTASAGYYFGGSSLEVQTNGAVRAHPLDFPDAYGMLALEDDLLVFSLEGHTRLSVLTGEILTPTAQRTLSFLLPAEDPSIQVWGSEFSFYDPTEKEVLVLDRSLNTVSRIPAPEDLVGSPLLSENRSTLYYCTDNAVRAWDLETGIRSCVKDMAYEVQSVTGLHRDGTVLECTITDSGKQRTLFLSTEDGSLLWERDGDISLKTLGEEFYAVFDTGSVQACVFGSGEPSALTPRDLTARTVLLPEQNAAVSVFAPTGGRMRLEYFALAEGTRNSSLEWSTGDIPTAFTSAGGYVYFLTFDEAFDRDVIYRWDPAALPVSDNRTYTGTYYTAENPDREGLERCRTYANIIGQQHGIQVKLWEDATAIQPWDYDLEPEYLVPVLEQALQELEQRLSQYPDGVLKDTASHFSSLTICLVRSITGSAESGSLDAATGIQFFEGSDAYVVIAPGEYARQALYHELFHVMETHLLTRPTALDRWEELNPTGFRYDYSYITNKSRDSGIYLQNATRSFIDTYSMSFPKEDKARVMEYAMLPGYDELFQSESMQAKLRCLSEGLREGYDLEDWEETFLWEQYLE